MRLMLLTGAILFWSATQAEEDPVVHLYTWADYVAASVIRGFEEEYGIKVVYDTYDNDIILNTKLLAGSTGYDLVGMAGEGVQRVLPVGVFRKLDKSKLPNLKNLDQDKLRRASLSDPGNEHGVIYTWGGTGIVYNVEKVLARMLDAPITSSAMVLDPDVISRFADCGVSFLDDPGTMLRMALMYLGYDINTTSDSAWAEAEQVLHSVRPYVRYFSGTLPGLDLPAEETCVAVYWTGDVGTARRVIEDAKVDVQLGFVIPREGTNDFSDLFLIPEDAPHPDNAHLFLNYLMRAEVAAETSNSYWYNTANLAAMSLIEPRLKSDESTFPSPEVQTRMYTRKAYSLIQERKLNRLWARLKAGIQ
jgi:putrescine transport system substrate-binding protein